MNAGDGELDPAGHDCGMIANALKIFGNHQRIQCRLSHRGIGRNGRNELIFDLQKQVVHHIVIGDDRLCLFQIPLHIGSHALGDHVGGVPRIS